LTPRLVGILVAVMLAAGLSVAALATGFSAEDSATITEPGPVRAVEVEVESGQVAVVAGAASGAVVTRARRYIGAKPHGDDRVIDGVVHVNARCRVVRLGCETDYRIEVPAGVPVKVRAERGSVSISGMTGMVEVDAGAGDVRLDRTRGPVKVTTSAGDVDGVDMVAAFVDATTGAGRVRLTLAEPPGRLGLRTGAGAIDVGLPAVSGGYRVEAKAGAGRVDVGVEQNPEAARIVTANSGAGRISIHPR